MRQKDTLPLSKTKICADTAIVLSDAVARLTRYPRGLNLEILSRVFYPGAQCRSIVYFYRSVALV